MYVYTSKKQSFKYLIARNISGVNMLDFTDIVDYSIAGFGGGAISYSLLSAAVASGANIPHAVGPAIFGALTVLGAVGGFMKARKSAAKAEKEAEKAEKEAAKA